MGAVSGRRALRRPAALGRSQHYPAGMGGTSIPQRAAGPPPCRRESSPKAGRVRKQKKLGRHSPSRGGGSGVGNCRQRSQGPDAPPQAARKASRAQGRCSGKGLYLLLVLPARKYIGNATLGSLDKHTLASSGLHRV